MENDTEMDAHHFQWKNRRESTCCRRLGWEEAEKDKPDKDEEDELMEDEAVDAGTPSGASGSGRAGTSSATKSGTKCPST